MSGEPQEVRDARAAIAKLLAQLNPTPSAEWIEERTNELLLQFDERAPETPPTERL